MPYTRDGQYYLVGMRSANPFAGGYQPNQAAPIGPTSPPPAPWFIWNGTGWYEDPNLRQQYEEQQQAEKLLPIMADMQKARERNVVDVGLTGARLAADWESGGRDLAFKAAESDADRAMREWMQRRDMAARSQELAAGRAHDVQMSGLSDQQQRGRMGLASQYDLERLYADQAFRADESAAARRQQAEMEVLGSNLGLRNLGVQSGLTGQRDKALAGMELERLAKANELARQNQQDQLRAQAERDLFMRDASVEDAYRNRGWSREDSATQHGYRLGELGMQFGQQREMLGLQDDMYRGRDAQEYVLNDAKATKAQLMKTLPTLDAPGRKKAEQLLREHAGIGKLSLRGPGLNQALSQWMEKVAGEDLELRKQPSLDEWMGSDAVYLDQAGRRVPAEDVLSGKAPAATMIMRDATGKPVATQLLHGGKASDTVSGQPQSAAGRFWSNDDGGKWRESMIKDVMTRHDKANPDKPMSYEAAFDEASKQAEAVDRMMASRQQKLNEQRAAPFREIMQEYAAAQFAGRPSKFDGMEDKILEAAQASGVNVDELYKDELEKARDKFLEENPLKPRPTTKVKISSEPIDPARDVGKAALQQGGITEVEYASRSGNILIVARGEEQKRKFQEILPDGYQFLAIDENNNEGVLSGRGTAPKAPAARQTYILPPEPSQIGNLGY